MPLQETLEGTGGRIRGSRLLHHQTDHKCCHEGADSGNLKGNDPDHAVAVGIEQPGIRVGEPPIQ